MTGRAMPHPAQAARDVGSRCQRRVTRGRDVATGGDAAQARRRRGSPKLWVMSPSVRIVKTFSSAPGLR